MGLAAVIFDLDGTLVDSVALILESFRYTLKQMGLRAEDEEILNTIGLPLKEVCYNFAGERGDEMFKCYVDYQDAIHDLHVKEYAGAADLLEYLKGQGCQMGIVTSKRGVMAKRGLAVAGLDKFMEIVVAFEDTKAHKPDPEPVVKALGALGAAPDEALYVGDSPYDIRCGKNAGVFTAGVTWGVSTEEQLRQERPDVIAHDWMGLKDFIRNL
jgi:pyrophosphatase PpaX